MDATKQSLSILLEGYRSRQARIVCRRCNPFVCTREMRRRLGRLSNTVCADLETRAFWWKLKHRNDRGCAVTNRYHRRRIMRINLKELLCKSDTDKLPDTHDIGTTMQSLVVETYQRRQQRRYIAIRDKFVDLWPGWKRRPMNGSRVQSCPLPQCDDIYIHDPGLSFLNNHRVYVWSQLSIPEYLERQPNRISVWSKASIPGFLELTQNLCLTQILQFQKFWNDPRMSVKPETESRISGTTPGFL